MTASSSIVTNDTNDTKVSNSTSGSIDKRDYKRVGDGLTITVEDNQKTYSSIELISPTSPQIKIKSVKNKDPLNQRWIVLASFSLLSFSSAVLWITFGPCLYIFMKHYKQTTSSYINALATVYMVAYPILLLPVLKIFDKWGLRQGVLIGAFLNALGTFLRFLGSFGPSGFLLLFVGQTIAAIAGIFILGVPPKLANVWFDFGEQNIATGIGVTANNAGVAAGFLLSPWFIKEDTAMNDIPTYLLIQFGACSFIYLICVAAFTSESKVSQSPSPIRTEKISKTTSTIKAFCKDKKFMLLTTSYGLSVGSSYAVSTVLAQIVVPVFKMHNETQVGLLGFLNVMAGIVGSSLIGFYLDRTFAYRRTCRILYIIIILALGFFTVGLRIKSLALVTVSCMFFGFSSFASTPVIFQYAPLITSSDLRNDEITSTGILNSSSQIWGTILIALMDATENTNKEFTMELSCWLLIAIVFVGIVLLWQVKEENAGEQETRQLMNRI